MFEGHYRGLHAFSPLFSIGHRAMSRFRLPHPLRCGTVRCPHVCARSFEGRCRVQFLRPSFSCYPTGLLCFKLADPGEVRAGEQSKTTLPVARTGLHVYTLTYLVKYTNRSVHSTALTYRVSLVEGLAYHICNYQFCLWICSG